MNLRLARRKYCHFHCMNPVGVIRTNQNLTHNHCKENYITHIWRTAFSPPLNISHVCLYSFRAKIVIRFAAPRTNRQIRHSTLTERPTRHSYKSTYDNLHGLDMARRYCCHLASRLLKHYVYGGNVPLVWNISLSEIRTVLSVGTVKTFMDFIMTKLRFLLGKTVPYFYFNDKLHSSW
jgi:hypothetical protein